LEQARGVVAERGLEVLPSQVAGDVVGEQRQLRPRARVEPASIEAALREREAVEVAYDPALPARAGGLGPLERRPEPAPGFLAQARGVVAERGLEVLPSQVAGDVVGEQRQLRPRARVEPASIEAALREREAVEVAYDPALPARAGGLGPLERRPEPAPGFLA